MRTDVVDPDNIPTGSKRPFSKRMSDLAHRISTEGFSDFEAGKVDKYEAAGQQALANLLEAYAQGDLPPKQAFGFLKALAERKTPDPVQRVEQRTEVDMKLLIGGLIERNQELFDAAWERAKERKEEVKGRLKMGDDLSLPNSEVVEDGIPITSAEPEEVTKIRAEERGEVIDEHPLSFYRHFSSESS